MEAIAVRKTRKVERSAENICSKELQKTLRKQAADTHQAIAGNFDPDTSETEKSCKEATLKTLKKYGFLP